MKRPYVLTIVCLLITVILGVFVSIFPFSEIECNIVLDLQNFARNTVGIQVFQVLTYLGDFYLWIIVASVYLLYAYFKSRRHLTSAIELGIFLIMTTALTYTTKIIFARPRPDCPGITVYGEDVISSFSYPSGHVSRATGAFIILSKGSKTKESLAATAIVIVSLSRIILGAHYLTDVIGGILLSIAAQSFANLIMLFPRVHRSSKRVAMTMS